MEEEQAVPLLPSQSVHGEHGRTIRKRRGGQPGNQNSREHGYFSKNMAEKYQTQMDQLPPAANPLEAAIQKQGLKMAALIEIDPLNIRVVSAAGRRYVKLQRAFALIHAMETNEDFREQFSEWIAQYGFLPTLPPLRSEKTPQAQKSKNPMLNYVQSDAVSRSGQ